MTVLQAIILGIVQGVSEFLPVSSSGHLLLLEKLGVGCESLPFNVTVHAGTLLAVLIAMRKSLLPLVRKPFQKTSACVIVACVPTIVLALVFKYLAPSLLEGLMLGFGFVLTAFLLATSEMFKRTQPALLTVKTSILTGILQGIAVLPGVSRSGATISALTLAGVEKTEAANFSFLLSVPIIIGSAIFEIIELVRSGGTIPVSAAPLIVGAASSFVSGLVSVSAFMKLLKNHSMLGFAVYTLILGIVVTLLPIWGIL